MRRLHYAIALIPLLSLSGCGALGAVGAATTGTIASVAPDSVNVAKRALTAAHDLHKTTADFLTIAATSNLCHATCASTAKVWLDQSEAYLVAADKLAALGDAPGIELKIKASSALLASIQNLIGK